MKIDKKKYCFGWHNKFIALVGITNLFIFYNYGKGKLVYD
jgi:hypothetical protein